MRRNLLVQRVNDMLKLRTNDLRILRLIIQEYEVLYSRYIMRVVKRAARQEMDNILVFESEDGVSIKGVLPRDGYRGAINDCIDVFVKHEEFELASEAQKVRDLVDIYLLLSEPLMTTTTACACSPIVMNR